MICNINAEKNNKELLMNHKKNALCCQTLMRVSNKTASLMLVVLRRRIKNRKNKSTLCTILFLKTLTNPFLSLFFADIKCHL